MNDKPPPIDAAEVVRVFRVAADLGGWQPVSPEGRSLDQLTGDIKDAHQQVLGALRYGAIAAIAAGKSLIIAKKLCGHGNWLDYIGLECRLSERTAQVYVYLARHEAMLSQLLNLNPQNSASLSQSQALKLLDAAKAGKRKTKIKTKKPQAQGPLRQSCRTTATPTLRPLASPLLGAFSFGLVVGRAQC
jgi:hypothetical protein